MKQTMKQAMKQAANQAIQRLAKTTPAARGPPEAVDPAVVRDQCAALSEGGAESDVPGADGSVKS